MIKYLQGSNTSLHRHKTALWNVTYSGFIRQVLLILETSILTGITIFEVCKKAQIFHVRYLDTRHITHQTAIIWENIFFSYTVTMMYNQFVWKYVPWGWNCFEKYVISPSVVQKTGGSCIKYCKYVISACLKIILLTNKKLTVKLKLKK